MEIRLATIGRDRPVLLAADELKSLLPRLHPGTQVSVLRFDEYQPAVTAWWIGCSSRLPVQPAEVPDPVVDDAIAVEVGGESGVITGSNPRSVLLGGYQLLTELGCRWFHPGPTGEHIPTVDLRNCRIKIRHAAAYRHRGVCLEGSVSYRHVAAMLEWLPKVGLNAYFPQFMSPVGFYDRWYNDPEVAGERRPRVTAQEVAAMVADHDDACANRGILLHAPGHGWTGAAVGVDATGWDVVDAPADPAAGDMLAQVDGKREFWGGIPLNTELCYSDPDVRQRMTTALVNYCNKHQHIDYVHYWLSDGVNNHCECQDCRELPPSDQYARLLAEADRALEKEGIAAKVVFLVYLNLLHAPQLRLPDSDRWVLMFAPITRSYGRSYAGSRAVAGTIAPYVRNRMQMPSEPSANVAHLRQWQRAFDGDGFAFEYHLAGGHIYDPGYALIGEVAAQDIGQLSALGLNGMMHCRIIRAALPTALPQYVMARRLWTLEQTYPELADDYFGTAFGAAGAVVRHYLERVTELFDPARLADARGWPEPAVADRLARVPSVVAELREHPLIGHMAAEAADAPAQNVRLLLDHAGLVERMSALFACRADGDLAGWDACVAEVKRYCRAIEDRTADVFDVVLYLSMIDLASEHFHLAVGEPLG